jgi:tRNA-dihydrouridine synthase B
MKFRNLEVESPLLLSPMSGFTNLPFRVAVRAVGGLSVTTTDFVNARALLELSPKAIRLVGASADDRPLGVQLFGASRSELTDAAQFLQDLGIDFIDINLGCPSHKVTRGGAGAALMKDEELTEELLEAIVRAVDIPVTAKMRLGWDEETINAHRVAPRLEAMGVAAIAVHGRTKEQGYTGEVNLDAIARVKQSVRDIPVIGNGDVHSHLDARRMIEEVGCDGVMVGRAALADPFFFRDTLNYLRHGIEPADRTLTERVLFMNLHYALAVRFWGEWPASLQFRKVIPGYSEHFERKTQWRLRGQEIETMDDYRSVLRDLLPAGMEAGCYFPVPEDQYYREALQREGGGGARPGRRGIS